VVTPYTRRAMRPDSRACDQLRPVTIEVGALPYPEGSCVISTGATRVICTASVEDRVPPFRKGSGLGWVTAEYAMLPRSTQTRTERDGRRGRVDGRVQEIQRLIGRSLRGAVEPAALGERSILIDCDVVVADGGTRTASITGGYVALALAIRALEEARVLRPGALRRQVAAVSAGIVAGEPRLDLCYLEDAAADTDMNCVGARDGGFIEIQGTAEQAPFRREELARLIELAEQGLDRLYAAQDEALGSLSAAG
jgi:ribonuclease PH